MAVNFASMMLDPSPVARLDFGDALQQREQLRLMREKFEEEKEYHRQQLEQARRATEAENARAKLLDEREKQKQKLAALDKFNGLNGAGKYEEAAAMIPQMTFLGINVDKLGDVDGLPSYRIDGDAQAAAAEESRRAAQTSPYGANETAEQSLSRLGVMGYDSTGGGAMNEPAGISESLGQAPVSMEGVELSPTTTSPEGEEVPGVADVLREPDKAGVDTTPVLTDLGPNAGAYGRMLAASAAALDKGELAYQRGEQDAPTPLPTVKPDEEDYTGAVPKNVVDMGAIQRQTRARLSLALEGMVQSYPEPFQESMRQTTEGVKRLGLPAADAVKLADDLRGGGPDQLIQAQLAANAAAGKREEPSRMERSELYNRGYGNAAKAGDEFGLNRIIERRGEVALGIERLTNNDTADDHLVGALVSRLMGERGATTENDVQRALGTAAMSFLDKIKTYAYGAAIGGLSAMQRKALLGVLKDRAEADKKTAFSFLRNADALAEAPGQDPEVARGVRDYRNAVVDKDLRDEYDAMRKPQGEAPPSGGSTAGLDPETGATLDKLSADAGLNPAAVRATVGRESGGSTTAVNSFTGKHGGMLQFAKDNWPALAKAAGTPDVTWEDMLKMTPAQQAPYVVQYFKGTGVGPKDDAGEYAMAAFMPVYRNKPDGFVLGEKGSKEIAFGKVTKGTVWEQNPSLREGDTITVGGVKRRGRGEGGSAEPAQSTASTAPAESLGVQSVGNVPSAAERLRALSQRERR